MDASEFKYHTDGGYHWSATYNRLLRRFDPRADARYQVPLAALRRHGALGAGKRGLDVGCGDGVMLYKVLGAGGAIAGVDRSLAGLRIARAEIARRAGREPALVRGSADALPFADGSVDFVTSIEVIEHLDDADRHLSDVRRVLAPGGILVLTTPHRRPDGVVHDPYHVLEYDAAGLAALLRRHFASVDVRGMFPAMLDRLDYRATGLASVDKLVRFGFKVVSRWLINPYQWTRATVPETGWDNLVAVCRV